MSSRPTPTSTYRLQLHADFGFAAATDIVPYLDRLGVSHLYLSPILQAAPGSMHGYDVVDHSTVSADLGGEAGLLDLAEALHRHGMGIVVDVVPNHMAIPSQTWRNRQLWEVLRDGRASRFADWFDIDWEHLDGRFGLPILGASLDEVIEAGELSIRRGAREDGPGEFLKYGDNELPLAPDSVRDDLRETLAGQHYLLDVWTNAAQTLNYRRFFDVDTLIAVRVETPDVFDAAHAVLFDLYDRGVVDGFRIDHPDGLADPEQYLGRMRDRTGGAWVVVEKILEGAERLPRTWATAGTTGYDAMRAIQAALVPGVGAPLTKRWQAVGGDPSYEAVEQASKGYVVDALFQPEVRRLARTAAAAAAARDARLDEDTAAKAFAAMLGEVDRYRAYIQLGEPPQTDALEQVARLAQRAAVSRPDLAESLKLVRTLVTDSTSLDPATRDLVVRFQQVCGPVMAKGVEDTTFYRYHRLIPLNEVGGAPRDVESPDVGVLHAWATDQATYSPSGMTTLSTHDTKRSEDTRARLLAAAEDLEGWDQVVDAVRQAATGFGVDGPTSYLIAQTLLGAWPIETERLQAYVEKAIRESKTLTSWREPDADYERRVAELVRAIPTQPDVIESVTTVVACISSATRAVTLAAKLLQLTLPGVPDVYQGSEIVERTLVDPDNRRPVDYQGRQELLGVVDASDWRPDGSDLDAEKLWLTSSVLRLRRTQPDLFVGGYQPIPSSTPHLLGFLRGKGLATLVTRWPLHLGLCGWGDAVVELEPGVWRDVLTGRTFSSDAGPLRCSDVFDALPVALLLEES